jgi:hypothetical protein
MEFIFLRILKGRLSFKRDDLSLYIVEPNQDLMYNSIEIYEEAYDKAYGQGVMLKAEALDFLIEKDMWSPFDDMELEKIIKENDQLKVQAFKNFFRKRELNSIKFLIKKNESRYSKLAQKKAQLDHLTCEGVASYSRWNWIILNSTYDQHGELYNWEDIPLSSVMSFYERSTIDQKEFRTVARFDNWRSMWSLGKKTGNIFGKSACELTRDQLTLCSYSAMYDSVYEHPESPNEKIIEDDDCLDGWFIDQKQKNEKAKKEQEVNSMISNDKIAKSGEIFLIAGSKEEAESIHSINSQQAEANRKSRMELIKQKGVINSDLEFLDVKQDIQIQKNQALSDHLRRK